VKRNCARSLALAVLASAVACSSGTAPVLVPVDFTTARVGGVPWSDIPIPPAVQLARGRIEVTGVIHTPDPCQDLRAHAVRANPRIILTVTARSRSGGCVTAIGTFGYTAVIDGVPPGTYALEVAYAYENTGWQRKQAVASEVTVP
jgi:hypothetical protein